MYSASRGVLCVTGKPAVVICPVAGPREACPPGKCTWLPPRDGSFLKRSCLCVRIAPPVRNAGSANGRPRAPEARRVGSNPAPAAQCRRARLRPRLRTAGDPGRHREAAPGPRSPKVGGTRSRTWTVCVRLAPRTRRLRSSPGRAAVLYTAGSPFEPGRRLQRAMTGCSAGADCDAARNHP